MASPTMDDIECFRSPAMPNPDVFRFNASTQRRDVANALVDASTAALQRKKNDSRRGGVSRRRYEVCCDDDQALIGTGLGPELAVGGGALAPNTGRPSSQRGAGWSASYDNFLGSGVTSCGRVL